MTEVCLKCGEPVIRRGRGRPPKYCPQHQAYTARSYRNDPGFRARHVAYLRQRAASTAEGIAPRPCATCGISYRPRTRHQTNRFCSRACRDTSDLARQRCRAKARERRLSRPAGGASYRDRGIFQRDRWRCGLCGKRIGKSYVWPHPRSASIDHVVPLSMGGEDVPENVQAAHLVCNVSKGNRGGGEQLALVG